MFVIIITSNFDNSLSNRELYINASPTLKLAFFKVSETRASDHHKMKNELF